MVLEPLEVGGAAEPCIHHHQVLAGGEVLFEAADDFLQRRDILTVPLEDFRPHEQSVGIDHGGKDDDLAVVTLLLAVAALADPGVLHLPLEVGVRQVEQENAVLDVEHRTHPLVKVVLHLAVDLVQVVGPFVKGVLGYLVRIQAEHLAHGRVLADVFGRLELGVRIDGAGDDLHQGYIYLLLAPSPAFQKGLYAKPLQRGMADVLGADGTRHFGMQALQFDAHLDFPGLLRLAAGLFGQLVGTFLGLLLLFQPLAVEPKRRFIQARLVAQLAGTFVNQGCQQVGQFLAVRLGREVQQFSKAEHRALLDLAVSLAIRLAQAVVGVGNHDCLVSFRVPPLL